MKIPVVHTRRGNTASIIASLSTEGIQSLTTVDVNEEGNIDGERFLQAFIDDILPSCEAFPGKRSVFVMNNAHRNTIAKTSSTWAITKNITKE